MFGKVKFSCLQVDGRDKLAERDPQLAFQTEQHEWKCVQNVRTTRTAVHVVTSFENPWSRETEGFSSGRITFLRTNLLKQCFSFIRANSCSVFTCETARPRTLSCFVLPPPVVSCWETSLQIFMSDCADYSVPLSGKGTSLFNQNINAGSNVLNQVLNQVAILYRNSRELNERQIQ